MRKTSSFNREKEKKTDGNRPNCRAKVNNETNREHRWRKSVSIHDENHRLEHYHRTTVEYKRVLLDCEPSEDLTGNFRSVSFLDKCILKKLKIIDDQRSFSSRLPQA